MKPTYYFKNPNPIMPFKTTLLWLLALDFWNAPEWLWGIAIFVLLLLWIIIIWAKITYIQVDLFAETLFDNKSIIKSRFKQMIEQMQNEARIKQEERRNSPN